MAIFSLIWLTFSSAKRWVLRRLLHCRIIAIARLLDKALPLYVQQNCGQLLKEKLPGIAMYMPLHVC